MLERTYDVYGDDLAGQLTKVAGKLAEEYWTEHQQDFFYIVNGSFLEEYDEFNIGVQFMACLLYTSPCFRTGVRTGYGGTGRGFYQ